MMAVKIKLEKYFSQKNSLVDWGQLIDAFATQRALKKAEYLIQPGDRSNFLAFITQGAFRVYFIDEKGNEVTTWFSFDGMFVTDLLAYYKESAAIYFVEAMEASEVLIAYKDQLEKLYLLHSEYREFGRRFAENGMVQVMERMVTLQSKSAEQRYLELLQAPHFMERIPLKYLASFLGVTDTSLSRIRKNIKIS